MEDEAVEEFQGINTENPNAVVIGLAPSKFNYEKVSRISQFRESKKLMSIQLNEAFRLLSSDPSVSLIAVHKARYFADKDEKLSMGPGGFVEGICSNYSQ